jgi:hypothetical protein
LNLRALGCFFKKIGKNDNFFELNWAQAIVLGWKAAGQLIKKLENR